MKIFTSDKNVKDVMTYEQHVLGTFEGTPEWSDIVNGQHQGIWRNGYKKDITKFMSDFLKPTIGLRELLLKKRVLFHIAVVGQSGTGKSSLCTSGIFLNLSSEEYRSETQRGNMYSLSPNFAVTDYPGMMGNDRNTFDDANLDALKQTIESIDFVIVLIKFGQRDIDFTKMFEAI